MRPAVPAPRRALAALDAFLFKPTPRTAGDGGSDLGAEPGNRPRGTDGSTAPPVILATAIGSAGGAASIAAAVGVALSGRRGARGVLLIDVDPPARGRGPTVLASQSSRELEDRIRALGGPFGAAAARGHLCYLPLPGGEDPLEPVAGLLDLELPASAAIVHLPQSLWPAAVAASRLRAHSGLMRADLPADRSLAALAVRELHDRGLRAKVTSRPLGRVASRRALAGIEPGGAASVRAMRLARGLLPGESRHPVPFAIGGGGPSRRGHPSRRGRGQSPGWPGTVTYRRFASGP